MDWLLCRSWRWRWFNSAIRTLCDAGASLPAEIEASASSPEGSRSTPGATKGCCGAGVSPRGHFVCRPHRGLVGAHRRSNDGSVSFRSGGLCQRQCARESERCCQRDYCNFHGCLLRLLDRRQPHCPLDRCVQFFFSGIEAARMFTARRARQLGILSS
jgi:hypothetical protein